MNKKKSEDVRVSNVTLAYLIDCDIVSGTFKSTFHLPTQTKNILVILDNVE